jgi:short subunit dehydrogenase-like uncharacterized protein
MTIAVYGASGYQGGLVLAELVRRGADFVLAGRNPERLAAIAAEVGCAEAPRRLAEIDDHDGLVAAFHGCELVINCAGPFTPTGPAVVRAAIASGCHYIDTAGEQPYVKRVFDAFAADAERARVAVVPAVNDGCVPTDLVAHVVADRLGPIDEITVTHVIVGGGGMSRGSLRSLNAMAGTIEAGGLVYHDGDWRAGPPAGRARVARVTLPGDGEPTAVMPCPLPEVVTIPRHVRVRRVAGVIDAALGALLSPPIPPEAIDRLGAYGIEWSTS